MTRVHRGSPRLLRTLVLLLVAWGSAATSARAEQRRTAIALVSSGEDPELHARLRAEIAALGWRVTESAPAADVELAQVARRLDTLAVLRVGRGAGGIEVWVLPEVDAQAHSEWIDVDEHHPELAVLRAIEALRARFLELGIEPEASSAAAPEARAAPPTSASASAPGAESVGGAATSDKKRSPAVWLGLAFGGVRATSVGGPELTVSGSLRFELTPFALGLELWGPLSASRIEAAEGSADVSSTVLASLAEYRLGQRALKLGAGLGGALAFVSLRGVTAVGPRETRTDGFYRGLVLGRLSCDYQLSRPLRLRVETNVGVAAPQSGVRFSQNVVAHWGQPLLSAMLGLSWAPFGD